MDVRKHNQKRWLNSVGFLLINMCCSTVALSTEVGNQEASIVPENLYHTLPDEVIPDLAKAGLFKVGVRTLDIKNEHSVNPITNKEETRQLTVEVWYPAAVKAHQEKAHYTNVTRSGKTFAIQANAVRDADVLNKAGTKFPLIVLSHGYTGYRTIMYYLGEHLASNGYIVVGIDHTDSTNAEIDFKNAPFSGFPSTLLNRSRDQAFTREYLTKGKTFLSDVINQDKAGLVGYSMGGYGAVKSAGGCYNFTQATTSQFTGVKDEKTIALLDKFLNHCSTVPSDIPPSKKMHDSPWQAVVAMAPWGEQHQLFNIDSLQKIKTPLLYVAGNLDDIAYYPSIRKLFKNTGGKNTFLLTYENARHNIAPHPAPEVAYNNEFDLGHYAEPVWENEKLNEINKHFVLAMMNCYVKDKQQDCRYLDLTQHSAGYEKGKETPAWFGFDKRYSVGMQWESKHH